MGESSRPDDRSDVDESTVTHADVRVEAGAPGEGGAAEIKVEGYRILNEISRGAQAVVFAATFLKTGRKVALKVMHEGPLATEASRTRFMREAEILASLHHPNIVTIIDRGRSANGSEFFAMDYIEGVTLDEAMWKSPKGRGAIGENPAGRLQVFLKICDAVNAAHLRGIVHRDLKPSNIRVDERGEPHVLDFGLARGLMAGGGSAGELTLTGQFLGSLPWASPEQAEGIAEKIDSRSDVYSLGVILYQLITGGQFPYQVAGSMRDILNNIMTADPPAPSEILAAREARDLQRRARREVPAKLLVNPVLDAIILRALAKRRDDRYQSAGELARDIESYLAGRPTVAGGTRKAGMGWKPVAIAAAGVFVVAAVAIYFGMNRAGDSAGGGNEGAVSRQQAVQTQPAGEVVKPAVVEAGPGGERGAVHPLVAASPLAKEAGEIDQILGRFMAITDFLRGNAPQRMSAWRAAAESGDAVGEVLVGKCYEQGIGMQPNVAEAMRFLQSAAEKGLPMAQCFLGIRYRASVPPVQDFAQALVWYKKSADAGYGRAMMDIGLMHYNGQGTKVDYGEAMKWLKAGAAAGTPAASGFVGDMYYFGHGVPVDYALAMMHYRKAVEGEVPLPMQMIGTMYATGRGVQQDFVQAMAWYRKANAVQPPRGAVGMGDLYANGQGVPKDLGLAAQWYRQAAEGNMAPGMRRLAALYEAGTGVAKDEAQARMWYTKAAAAGDADARKWLAEHPAE